MTGHTHWLLTRLFSRTFCGLDREELKVTTDKDKVTCQNCKKLMRLHGHLGDEHQIPELAELSVE